MTPDLSEKEWELLFGLITDAGKKASDAACNEPPGSKARRDAAEQLNVLQNIFDVLQHVVEQQPQVSNHDLEETPAQELARFFGLPSTIKVRNCVLYGGDISVRTRNTETVHVTAEWTQHSTRRPPT